MHCNFAHNMFYARAFRCMEKKNKKIDIEWGKKINCREAAFLIQNL